MRMGYTYTYNSAGAAALKTSRRNSYSIRFNIEEAGNLLYAFSKMVHGHPQNGEAFQMANINFAQYVKADFDYAKNFMIDERNSLVFHVGLDWLILMGTPRVFRLKTVLLGRSQQCPRMECPFAGTGRISWKRQ